MVANRVLSDDPLSALYTRPGFLIRRANQIAVWLFLDETGPLAVTTTQYGALVVLRAVQNLDQIGLAKMLGIDRSTAALVVNKLKKAGYIAPESDLKDKRRNVLRLTKAGADALGQIADPAAHARSRLLKAFTQEEATQFSVLLSQFVEAFNGEARAPLMRPGNSNRHTTAEDSNAPSA